MTNMNTAVKAAEDYPVVRKIGPADIKDALAKGIDDFSAMPTFSLFIVLIYPVIGLFLFRLTFGYDLLPMAFPLIAGFPLVGPIAAIGLYELSRRRELGLPISWDALSDIQFASLGGCVALGVTLAVLFAAWLVAAMIIYALTFGDWVPPSIFEFAHRIFTTSAGWTLIFVGCGVGFLFAVAAFAISVISAPLLLDRDVGFAVAVTTSVRAVLANPGTMALWGMIVVAALVIGSLPLLVGLAVVLPVLGHATWHLYRKTIEH